MMTRKEFLERLKEALENELSGRAVQENVEYYNGYISEEMRRGRKEQEVVEELGDPWVIARTVIDMETARTEAEPERAQYDSGEEERRGSVRRAGGDVWWKKALLLLGVLGILVLVIAVVGGIFRLLMPILVPVIVAVLAVKALGSRRR